MHPFNCRCPSCVTRPGPVMGVVVPAPGAPDPKHGPWHWGRAVIESDGHIAQVWRTGTDGKAALFETEGPYPTAAEAFAAADARATVHNVPPAGPALCGCDESMRYRALLERVAARYGRPAHWWSEEESDLWVDIRAALALRGGR